MPVVSEDFLSYPRDNNPMDGNDAGIPFGHPNGNPNDDDEDMDDAPYEDDFNNEEDMEEEMEEEEDEHDQEDDEDEDFGQDPVQAAQAQVNQASSIGQDFFNPYILGNAAQMANIGPSAFLDLLGHPGHPVINYGPFGPIGQPEQMDPELEEHENIIVHQPNPMGEDETSFNAGMGNEPHMENVGPAGLWEPMGRRGHLAYNYVQRQIGVPDFEEPEDPGFEQPEDFIMQHHNPMFQARIINQGLLAGHGQHVAGAPQMANMGPARIMEPMGHNNGPTRVNDENDGPTGEMDGPYTLQQDDLLLANPRPVLDDQGQAALRFTVTLPSHLLQIAHHPRDGRPTRFFEFLLPAPSIIADYRANRIGKQKISKKQFV